MKHFPRILKIIILVALVLIGCVQHCRKTDPLLPPGCRILNQNHFTASEREIWDTSFILRSKLGTMQGFQRRVFLQNSAAAGAYFKNDIPQRPLQAGINRGISWALSRNGLWFLQKNSVIYVNLYPMDKKWSELGKQQQGEHFNMVRNFRDEMLQKLEQTWR